MNKKKTTFGVSFPDKRILQLGKEKAASLGISFSAYVNQVLRRDLNLPNVFESEDQPTFRTPPPAKEKNKIA